MLLTANPSVARPAMLDLRPEGNARKGGRLRQPARPARRLRPFPSTRKPAAGRAYARPCPRPSLPLPARAAAARRTAGARARRRRRRPGGQGGLDLPPPTAGATSLNPCDVEIGTDDEEETHFHAGCHKVPRTRGATLDAGARGVAPPCGWDGQEGTLEGLREMLVARRGDGFRCLLYDGIKADATERKQRKHPCTVWDVEVGKERRIQLLVSSSLG